MGEVIMEVRTYEEDSPFHVDLTFRRVSDARELADELQRWTPSGGWSIEALELMSALRGEKL